MYSEILYAIPLGLTLSFAAGPIFFVILETSISQGRMKAFTLDLGAILADLIFIVVAYYGSQALLGYLRNNQWIGILSGLCVAGFGLYYFRRARYAQMPGKIPIKRKRFYFVKGFLLNFLNIGVLIFWITSTIAVGSLLDHHQSSMILFYSATLATYLVIDLFKIYFANRFKRHLAGRRLQLVEKIMGVGLILFGLFIALRPWLRQWFH